ncbi:uncharacterized protein ASCRUDRAFT_75535 [Ascoidea rubescens DSM 1968]|uniref:SGT1-domain-containing protein n=1 Tax=Ascoidea rubescens DSM 1968 TaxID=1344418 RepID=A0A1D2VIS7_9ASCO|nr:hypothetical protein ASCRUDRAFT_75535 [Ascoidea rubescens DSM 1968]ODV61539.1 hypothetical protein ASCRUDRAFT_75535 [Ascoidea rubescens DSM 1968]
MFELVRPSPEVPWTLPSETLNHTFPFETSSLCCTLFYINPYLPDAENRSILETIHQNLFTYLKSWLYYYPWYDSSVKVFLVTDFKSNTSSSTFHSYNYIYIELIFDDYLIDEWLLTYLLFEFSKIDSDNYNKNDMFINFFDSDGVFLLIEAADHIPIWLEPSNSFNRIWLNNGNLKIIPNDFNPDKNLTLNQSLYYLNNFIFKLNLSNDFNNKIITKLNNYQVYALQNIISFTVRIQKDLFHFLLTYNNYFQKKNPINETDLKLITHNNINNHEFLNLFNLVSKSFVFFIKEKLPTNTVSKNFSNNFRKENLVPVNLKTSALTYNMLQYYINSKAASSDSQNYIDDDKDIDLQYKMGNALLSGLDNIISNQLYPELNKFIDKNKFDFQDYNLSNSQIINFNNFIDSDPLQSKLIDSKIITEKVLSNPDVSTNDDILDNSNETENINQKNVFNKLNDFFDDTGAGLDGVEVRSSNSISSSSSSFSDYDKRSKTEVEKAREYLGSEKVDIDEDDFFEYFLTNALQIPMKDLDAYRSLTGSSSLKNNDTTKLKKQKKELNIQDYNDESDYKSDSSSDHYYDYDSNTGVEGDKNGVFNLKESDLTSQFSALKNLLSSIRLDGGVSGPTSTLFNNLDLSKDDLNEKQQ